MKISAAIITFNEEENIERCISSLKKVADEILVVDSFSTDNTEKICSSLGVKFLQNKFEGHISQKNFAMKSATHDFVLSLDADEQLSNELIESILKIKESADADAYIFNRLNNYCGKWIKHGVWYPDRKIRLWNRTKGEWGGTNPHDKIVMQKNSSVKNLSGNLFHYTVKTPAEYKLQMEKFSSIAADEMLKRGKSSSQFEAVVKGYFAFVRSYVLRAGLLDGKAGYEIANGYARYTYLKYFKTILSDKK